MPVNRSLTRKMAYRRFAGVCAGLADYFGIDVTLIRVLFVLSVFFGGGVGFLAYLIGWLVMPSDRVTTRPLRHSSLATVIFLICVGLIVAGWVWNRFLWASTQHGSGLIVPLVFVALAGLAWFVLHRRRLARQRHLAGTRPTDLPYAEPSAQQAPPAYMGGDPLLRIDSFYPPSPAGPAAPGSQLPPSGGTYAVPPADPPSYPTAPPSPLDLDDHPSGFQPQ